ncbi:hypothetical protein GCM10010359_53650 [Streptomyces morookaense]|nr:hypothetical protein GCM10010359_53650 [Streptomyces morookaense]
MGALGCGRAGGRCAGTVPAKTPLPEGEAKGGARAPPAGLEPAAKRLEEAAALTLDQAPDLVLR